MDLQKQAYIQQDETTFSDIIKMFRGKMKILICVVLIAAALGAAAGAAVSFFAVSYNGDIEFYISPTDSSNRLVQFLKSDSFAEKLLLDEYGLPHDSDKNSQDYLDAKAAIIAADEAREIKQELVKEYEKFSYEVAVIENEYNKLDKEYGKVLNELSIYKNAESGSNGLDTLGPSHQAKVEALEKDLEIARVARENYAKEYYYPATKKRVEMEESINIARTNVKETRELAEEAAEKVLAPWREQEEVRKKVDQIRKFVTFEYARFVENEKLDEQGMDNQNQAFLIVKISVDKDEELANEILVSIMNRLPDYVEKSVESLTGINEVKCNLVSTFASIESSLSDTLFKNIIIFAFVAALLSAVVVIAVVIFKNMFGDEKAKSDNKTKEEKRSEKMQ